MTSFECDGCGACCRTYDVFASAEDARREPRIEAEAKRLAPWLETPDWAYRLFPPPFLESGCFLDAGDRCTIYATRPEVCRAFPAGSDPCQEARARVGLPRLAPVSDASAVILPEAE